MNNPPVLITCSACKSEISSQATACLKCGHPNSSQYQSPPIFYNQPHKPLNHSGKKTTKILTGCLVLFFGVPLFGILCAVVIPGFIKVTPPIAEKPKIQATQTQSSPSPSVHSLNSGKPDMIIASVIVKRYLLNTLNDPDSLDDFDIVGIGTAKNRKNGYIVRANFRAKNAFGAMILSQKDFLIVPSKTGLGTSLGWDVSLRE